VKMRCIRILQCKCVVKITCDEYHCCLFLSGQGRLQP